MLPHADLRRVSLLFGVLLALVSWVGPAQAADAPEDKAAALASPLCADYTCGCRKTGEPKCPPKYENLRFRENWRPCFCMDPCDRKDWSDWIKQLSPGGRGWFRVDFGGQVRFRYEGFENQRFGKTRGSSDTWALGRFRAHADFQFGEHFRIFAEGIYADQWGRSWDSRGIDVNQGDLLNLFAEVRGKIGGYDAGVAAGRREILFGKQRLISPLDWANTRRTFDGAYGWLGRGQQRLDFFFTRPVVIEPYDIGEWNEDVDFWGAYYANKTLTCLIWEVYVLGLHRDNGVYFGNAGAEDRFTVGGRINHKIEGTRFDYDAEGGAQFGTMGSKDILAGFFSIEAGWRPRGLKMSPRLAVGFDYASGNHGDGSTVGTFNQLYPLGHAYLGYMDLIGRQNILAGRLTATFKPAEKLTVRVDWHGFWRESADDAVYHAGGGILRAPGGSNALYVGNELDFSLIWTPERHWRWEAGICHFFTGQFLSDTGSNEDIDFFYLSGQYTF